MDTQHGASNEYSSILKQQLEKENWWKWEMNPICNQMLTYLLNMILSDDSDSSNSSENLSSREPSVDRGLDFSKEKTIYKINYFSLIMATSIAEILQFKINVFSKIICVSF